MNVLVAGYRAGMVKAASELLIRSLGGGGEGFATLVKHPVYGTIVKKTYDPTAGRYSRVVVKRKEQLGKLDGLAELIGVSRTDSSPVHFYEHIKGKPITSKMLARNRDLQTRFASAQQSVRARAQRLGFEMYDLRPDNAVMTPDGHVVFVDFMPLRAGEVQTIAQQRKNNNGSRFPDHIVPLTPRGDRLFPNWKNP